MAIIAKAGGSGPSILPPAGIQHAVCAFVEDVGDEYSEMFNKTDRKVVIIWELAERIPETYTDSAGNEQPVSQDIVGRPFMLSKSYTLSLGKKANLRRDLESWRGKQFTEAELEGFDIEVLKGKACMLNVIHEAKDGGGTRAKIAAVTPPMKGLPLLTIEATEPPKWVAERREANAKAMSTRSAHQARQRDDHAESEAAGFDEVPF